MTSSKSQYLTLIFALFFSIPTFSQVSFVEGYIIDENDRKINCFIKNEDWKDNPGSILYKTTEGGIPISADIYGIKEFGVGSFKYIGVSVQIDRSSDQTTKLDKEKNPIFNEERLFLEVLVEGPLNLYGYVEGNLKRYFFSSNNSELNQLIYKRYIIDLAEEKDYRKERIVSNNTYKQQLINAGRGLGVNQQSVKNLRYQESSLKKLFIRINEEINGNYAVFDKAKDRELFNLTFRPGVNLSTLQIAFSSAIASGDRDIDYGYKTNFRFGLESEVFLRFNQNKWVVIIEPIYQYYQSNGSDEVSSVVFNSEVSYQSIQLPLGIRHYFYLNENSKLFLNALLVYDIPFNSSVDIFRTDGVQVNTLEIKPRHSAAAGIGYKHSDRISFEARYLFDRELFGNLQSWTSDYQSLSLILGYTLF